MMIRMGVLAVGLALAGCAATPPPPPANYAPPEKRNLKPAKAVDETKRAVTAKLKDPESARFSDVAHRVSPNARGEPTDVVCGKVNAKNSFGGYTGARPFVYFIDRREVTMSEGDNIDREIGLTVCRNFCAGGFGR